MMIHFKDIIDELEEIRPYNYSKTDDELQYIAQKAIKTIEKLREQRKELLEMALEALNAEFPEYKLQYERNRIKYEAQKKALETLYND
jgi:hypothetical protein